MKAFVLMKIRIGSIPEVVSNLRSLQNVAEARSVLGPYDVIAVIEAKDMKQMGQLVNVEIQVIPGVLDTLTCLAIDE